MDISRYNDLFKPEDEILENIKCKSKDEIEREINNHLADIELPKEEPTKEPNQKRSFAKLETFSLGDLKDKVYPETEWIADNLIPFGINILGAAPKTGKSWFALDLAYQVATGGYFMGKACTQRDVLYLALEDNEQRIQSRILKLTDGNIPVCNNLHFSIHAEKIRVDNDKRGLIGQINELLTIYPNIELIIIDTLQMVKLGRRGSENEYENTYAFLNSLRILASRHICILLIHHTKKTGMLEIDPFEKFLGSTAFTGGTDNMYIIQSRKDEPECDFLGRGRDIESFNLKIKLDAHCRWLNLGDTETFHAKALENRYKDSPYRKTILKLFEEVQTDFNGNKTLYITAKDLRDRILEHTNTLMGNNVHAFTREISKLDDTMYQVDGIKHKSGRTTFNGKNGLFQIYILRG